MIGVYSIKNKITGEQYIGSSIDLQRRKSEHYSSLRRSSHENKKLQNAFSAYGESNFEYSILQLCSMEELLATEENLIRKYNTYHKGYNNTDKVISGSVMQHLEVRQKHWGELHGGSKYPNQKIIEVFNLLAKTNFSHHKISQIANVSEGIVSYVKSGGHSWVWLECKELAELVKNRATIKEEHGTKYSNKDILDLFDILVKNPDISLDKISEQIGISKETISAVSCGRQYKSLILAEYNKSVAEEYYSLGRVTFAKKYKPTYSQEELKKCEKMMEYLVSHNKWLGRDKLEHIGGSTLARKLSEFDEGLYSEMLKAGVNTNLVLSFINLKRTKKVSDKIKKIIDALEDNIIKMTATRNE